MSGPLKAKVKNAANLLQQRKLLQRHLRSLQQHSLSRDILAAYRNRMHALPPPEALRTMTPYMNERMRKRRCFADKDLEMVMIERERQFEMAKSRIPPINHSQLAAFQGMACGVGGGGGGGGMPPTAASLMNKPRALLGNLSPREFLQRIFPSHNPNVLELVWQGCGGNLERAIEQLASGIKPDGSSSSSSSAPSNSASPGAASSSAGPAHNSHSSSQPMLQQQRANLQQQQQQHQMYLQAAAAAGMLGFPPGGVPVGPGVMTARPRDPRMTALQNQGAAHPSQHPSFCAFPFPFLPAVRPPGLPLVPKSCANGSVTATSPTRGFSSLLRGFQPTVKRLHPWFENSNNSSKYSQNSLDDFSTRKSAFRSLVPAGSRDDGSSNAQNSDRGSVVSDRSSVSPVPNTPPSSHSRASSSSDELSDSERMVAPPPVQTAVPIAKTRLKFSVESIIGHA
ncbi:hypothetical protein V1264_023190 [Littorina saxatilis]